jgi:hypothetical protein
MKELHNQGQSGSEDMRYSYLDHPSPEVLERFVLHRSPEQEIELIETHMLACESCVSAVENLEMDIAAMKLALNEFVAEHPAEPVKPKAAFWQSWFTVPTLSWAAAGLAACAFCVFALVPNNVELFSNRGIANIAVPEWRNTHLTLTEEGLPAGPLRAEIVNQTGTVVWVGNVNSTDGHVTVKLPRMTSSGHYYARLYTPGAEHDLLSEFPFVIKFQL